MNTDLLLEAILAAANYPKEKREKFINTFYIYVSLKLLNEVEQTDSEVYKKLLTFFKEGDTENSKKVWEEISENPELSEKLNKITDGVVNEIVDDISEAATTEQKRKILDSLPS